MTSTSNLADVVRHYQRSIERHPEDETRLLHCITKLFNLPITFEHLQETGIGKTVNALRKINGEVGVAAKTLVTKWKAMVAAEEEPAGQGNHTEEDSNRSNGRRSSDEEQDQENKGSNSSGGEDKSKHESRRPKSSDHKSKSSSSSSKSHSKSSRSDSDKRHKSSSDDKTISRSKEHRKEQKSSSNGSEHRKSKESLSSTPAKSSSNHSNHKSNHSSDSSNNNNKQKHHSSSSHKSDHSKSKHDKIKEDKQHHSNEPKLAKEKSDKHKSSSTSSSSSKRTRSPHRLDDDSPQSKKPKSKPKSDAVEQKETADGFDSSMGANFDDVLGMLNIPISGKKNSLKLKSPNKPTSTTALTNSTVSTGSAAAPSAAKRIATTATTSSSSRITSTRKPELLASSAKLEPLDPSIALELPTISNNYKPMPLNQTVMDVVFNHGLSSSASRAPRINESEALAAGISSKTMRTKIYSGVRTGQILQVPSLFDLCIRVLQKNIDALEYTGGVPFEVLRPVLERATPHQLLNFEEYNPYLMEDSDVLWQQHVHRHCRSQHREEMETWREMFLRCEEEKARRLSVLAESIKASQKISEAPVRKTQLAFVDTMVKPPRNVQKKQEQYGTKGKMIATPAARVAALSSVTPNAAKVGDARLRVLNSARDAAQVSAPMRNRKAPLMLKALQQIRGRHRR
ncbi:transcription elongation factor B polypeptide 3 [Drosophila innubila]|uniref:transcription elongation factor B polypeptide 3 n=1 Tax=Drosophila innubila TaxID=198719 RepID=UPI00148E5CA8|nr:transcription elongation factor B polypeptide 3 [Drosophila innubila]